MIRSQAGHSLVEVLFSLIILTVGVLAAVRSLAVMNRTLASGSVLTRVAVLAGSRVEALTAVGCSPEASRAGEAGSGGIQLRWHSHAVSGAKELSVVVSYPLNHEHRADTFGLYHVCPDES